VGFIGVNGYTVCATKKPDGSIDINVSGERKTT
jgi:hypothetical protein